MTGSTTMSIRLSSETKAQLGLLATATRRSKSFLAAEAVADYVAQRAQIIEGIRARTGRHEGGRTVSHDAAMDEIDALIDGIEREDSGRSRGHEAPRPLVHERHRRIYQSQVAWIARDNPAAARRVAERIRARRKSR